MRKFKRQFALGDPHGCLNLVIALLNKIDFNPKEDHLTVMGDMLDRGSNSKGVIEFLSKLRKDNPDSVVLLKGNHEDMAYKYFTAKTAYERNDWWDTWRLNGGIESIESFGDEYNAKKILIPFIESLSMWYETDSHIFVHAGLPCGKSLQTATWNELLWDREFDYCGDKILVVGHTIHKEVVLYDNNILACDTGAFFGSPQSPLTMPRGKLSAVNVDTLDVFDVAYKLKSA